MFFLICPTKLQVFKVVLYYGTLSPFNPELFVLLKLIVLLMLYTLYMV